MTYISVLFPALKIHEYDKQNIEEISQQFFKTQNQDNFEYYRLIPLKTKQELIDYNDTIAIKLTKSELSLKFVEQIMQENSILKINLNKYKDALLNITKEYQVIVQDRIKNKKLKNVDQENAKLKNLLRIQLDNSEKMRIETQLTVENLKEDLDYLVKELTIAQKKSNLSQNSHSQQSASSIQNISHSKSAIKSQSSSANQEKTFKSLTSSNYHEKINDLDHIKSQQIKSSDFILNIQQIQ